MLYNNPMSEKNEKPEPASPAFDVLAIYSHAGEITHNEQDAAITNELGSGGAPEPTISAETFLGLTDNESIEPKAN